MKDVGIYKTLRDIRQAFFQLLESDGFRKITIGKICEVALVSRSTFYSHYQDKYDLLEKLVDEYSALFNQLAKQRADAILTAQLNVLSVSEITNDLKKHQSELNTLLKVHEEGLDLHARWEQSLDTLWVEVSKSRIKQEVPLTFLSKISSSLIISYIEWTLASDEETDAPSKLMESIFTTIYK